MSSGIPSAAPIGAMVGLTVAAVAGTLYFLTAASDIVVGDTGELLTAAVVLGVAHPPGYPLFTMLGHLLSLSPFSSFSRLLGTDWYVRQLRERHPDLIIPFDRYDGESDNVKCWSNQSTIFSMYTDGPPFGWAANTNAPVTRLKPVIGTRARWPWIQI